MDKPKADSIDKTAVLEVRIDIRDLARVAAFLTEQGIRPRSRSEVVREGMKLIGRIAEEKIEQDLGLESVSKAVQFLTDLGLLGQTSRDHKHRALFQALQDESISLEQAQGSEDPDLDIKIEVFTMDTAGKSVEDINRWLKEQGHSFQWDGAELKAITKEI